MKYRRFLVSLLFAFACCAILSSASARRVAAQATVIYDLQRPQAFGLAPTARPSALADLGRSFRQAALEALDVSRAQPHLPRAVHHGNLSRVLAPKLLGQRTCAIRAVIVHYQQLQPGQGQRK